MAPLQIPIALHCNTYSSALADIAWLQGGSSLCTRVQVFKHLVAIQQRNSGRARKDTGLPGTPRVPGRPRAGGGQVSRVLLLCYDRAGAVSWAKQRAREQHGVPGPGVDRLQVHIP